LAITFVGVFRPDQPGASGGAHFAYYTQSIVLRTLCQ
jgi:hypothetical protein